jgi:hypothetical protein
MDDALKDNVLADAAGLLRETGQGETAELLVSCAISELYTEDGENFVVIRGDEPAELRSDGGPRFAAAYEALEAALSPGRLNLAIFPNSSQVPEDPLADLLAAAKLFLPESDITNQGLDGALQWEPPGPSARPLRFRSQSEIRIAEALDAAGVLFFPNVRARVTDGSGVRKTVEPDFVVCVDGKWGILEVDGTLYHSSAAEDHQRDRFWHFERIRVVQRFNASRCFNAPTEVVDEFLTLLRRNG